MAELPYAKIKYIAVTFEHDSGEAHSMTFDLTNPDDIDEMADYMKDYHTMRITVLKEAFNVQIQEEKP